MCHFCFHVQIQPKISNKLLCISKPNICFLSFLTHWGRETHICVGKLTIIASDNGLSPGRRQAIIWTNAGILLIGPLGTKVSEISIGIQTFSFKKMQLNMSSAKWRPFCLGLNVLIKRLFHLYSMKYYPFWSREWNILEYSGSTRLTPKHRETHGCVVSTVATDALVLKHQAISIHNVD